jgi:hypothetical protein
MIVIVFPTGETGFFGLPLNTGAGFMLMTLGARASCPFLQASCLNRRATPTLRQQKFRARTHDLLVDDFADVIYYLEDGRINCES